MDYLLGILFLLSFGGFTLNKWGKFNVTERPTLFNRPSVISILNINAFVCLLLGLVLLFVNWKLLILAFVLGLIIGPAFIAPIITHLLSYFIH